MKLVQLSKMIAVNPRYVTTILLDKDLKVRVYTIDGNMQVFFTSDYSFSDTIKLLQGESLIQ